MANAALVYANLLLGSSVVITSSGDATGFPVTNLANPARWKPWRSPTATTDQWVLFDLGSNQNFQTLAVTDVTLHTSGGTLKAQANATNVWTAPTVSDTISPLPSPDLTHVLADWLSSVQSLRYIRFYFTNVGASQSFAQIGAAIAGTYFQPTFSIAPALTLVRHDPSKERLAMGGERSSLQYPKYHEINGVFRLQSDTDRETWRAVFDTDGATLPWLFSLEPGVQSLQFYGIMHPQPTSSGRQVLATQLLTHHHPSASLWDVSFEFMEDVA